jgi:starch phosphorylase
MTQIFNFNDFPNLPNRIKGLGELAENLWWSWNPEARMLFKRLDRQLWKDSTHNPDKMLKKLPEKVFQSAANNLNYMRHYEAVMSRFRKYMSQEETWLADKKNQGFPRIVYFSAEYGLHHSLPFYAGGLGFLAGDHIKEASDLRIPLVAVGFMYPEGYLKQQIQEDGWQESVAEDFDREAAPISKVADENGKQMVIQIPLIDPPIFAGVWQVDVGRVTLYLLDTDIEHNDPWNRKISSQLYTGDIEHRLRQEIVLGLGGSKMLGQMGIKQTILHLNEGHPGFAQLERIRELIHAGATYNQALEKVRNTTIFTTHTPVPAGHDIFPFHLIEKYFHAYWPALQLDRETFLQLGVHPDRPSEGFNMTVMALKMAKHINGVSQKHGAVSRRMWKTMWPDIEEAEIPIHSITNGIHVPTWIEPKIELLFNRYLGKDWISNHNDTESFEMIDDIPDKELWETHYWLKMKLIDAIRERSRLRWTRQHISPSIVLANGSLLDPSVLTIGFARRFATYKRADLIFSDMNRLRNFLNDPWRPIQIIFAGKAHPSDNPGKLILQRIFNESKNPENAGRIAFVEDYGELLAQYMVHGVDVWLNNPNPTFEACGTSGMKASLNGVPNLSILDGWWIEGFTGNNGWAFEGQGSDAADANEIYRILETNIIPTYYQDSGEGFSSEWVALMKQAIQSSGARFSARRMVKEYIDRCYKPALSFV